MNRRLYFILPNVAISKLVENDLLLARISEDHMHFLGKRGTDLQDLPEASAVEKTDLTHGIQVGLFSGALFGGFLGVILYLIQGYIGMQFQLGIILLLFLMGGILGVWISGFMVGSSAPNVKLKQFEHAMDENHILLMVDVPKERVDEIKTIIHKHHPEAEDHGMEPVRPVFP